MKAPATVLIVDDHDEARNPLCELLRVLNYRIVTAANGPDALAVLARGSFDVVVLDLGLPDVSQGLEVVRKASAYPCAPPIVAFTGFAQLKDAAMAAGCCGYVLKPDVEALLATLDALLRTKRETQPESGQRREPPASGGGRSG